MPTVAAGMLPNELSRKHLTSVRVELIVQNKGR